VCPQEAHDAFVGQPYCVEHLGSRLGFTAGALLFFGGLLVLLALLVLVAASAGETVAALPVGGGAIVFLTIGALFWAQRRELSKMPRTKIPPPEDG
jgi:hypothetical protein